MINKISINNFKCFKETTEIPLSKLNIFAGVNGRGKSTTLQSILLFKQSEINRDYTRLILNGDYTQLGSYDDIKNIGTTQKDVILNFDFNDGEINFNLVEDEKDEYSLRIYEIKNNGNPVKFDKEKGFNFYSHFERTHFISAARIGPKNYHEKQSLDNFVNVGTIGEKTAMVLHKHGDDDINEVLFLNKENTKKVISQTQEWINYIFDGATMDLKGKGSESSVLNLLFNNYKPTNVGFGFAYILPIIVSGLISKPNDILIVENPEAHLHPKAQARITEFLSKVASTDVQVFIETHSEHIINAARINTLIPEINLNAQDVNILFFDNRNETIFTKIDVLKDGSLSDWIEDFFDQQKKDLTTLFKLQQKE